MTENVTVSDDLRRHGSEQFLAVQHERLVPCKVCGEGAALFDWVDFHRACTETPYPFGLSGVPVAYRMCPRCRFLFTNFFDTFTADQWREHVYNDDYVRVDPDYLAARPLNNAREIHSFFGGRHDGVTGLDFGGGSGLTGTLLRRAGWTYDSYDPFGHTDMAPERIGHYNFCSAFEVFEHTSDPAASMQSILDKMVGNRFFIYVGTGAHDGLVNDRTRLQWGYIAPRNGHISIYSRHAIRLLAERFDLTYHDINFLPGTHLLTRGIAPARARLMLLRCKLGRRLRQSVGAWPASLSAAPSS